MTDDERRQWRIAAALAHACGLDWGKWAMGLTKPRPYWPGKSESDKWERDPVTPLDDPSDAEAYRSDCARRGVEPGPLPSLSGVTPTGIEWRVSPHADWVTFDKGPRRGAFLDLEAGSIVGTDVPILEWIEIGELARVAVEAMR